MTEPVSSIRNLGPASNEAFARAGIDSADQLRSLGPDAAYERLLASGTRPHFIGFYSLVMGLQGRAWNDARGSEKADLRTRFDAIKAKVATRGVTEGLPPSLSDALDRMGVRSSDSHPTQQK